MWQLSHFRKFVTLAAVVISVCAVTSLGEEPFDHVTPFVDPLEFDPDFQMFKPFDSDDYGGPPQPRVGWFLNYDRMYIAMSRPQTGGTFGSAGQILGKFRDESLIVVEMTTDPLPEPVETNIDQIADTYDFTYGNRLDIGFMTDENHGWLFSKIKVNNPNFILVNDNSTMGISSDSDPGISSDSDQEEDPVTSSTISVYGDLLGAQLPETNISINSATFNSLELMKLFRMDRLHNNIVIEPMFGIRYIEFRDIFFATAVHFGEAPGGGGGGAETGLGVDDDTEEEDDLVSVLELDAFNGSAKNQMMTGQFGFRTYGARGRWHLGAGVRVFSGLNYQVFERNHRQEFQTGGADDGGDAGGGADADADADGGGGVTVITADPLPFTDAPVTVSRRAFELTELVIGTELRANASYAIWRDVAINFGFEMILVGRGVARGFDLENDEQLVLVGGTVGFVINR